MNLDEELNQKKQLIDFELNKILPGESAYPNILFKAMRYSVFAGGKRLRPVMLMSICELFGGNVEKSMPFACAIELIHTYSLIHDDLPALDNDNFRRGRLTSHKAFGENVAILAGDGLLSYAFEIMANEVAQNPNKKNAKAMQAISFGAGINGMVSGQTVDVISEGKKITKQTLDFIHLNKTAALIVAAFKAGAYLGGADEKDIESLEIAATKLGVAFQIQDDILDVKGTFEELGKPLHSDEKNEKVTYISLLGLEESKNAVQKLSEEAVEILEGFGEKSEFIVELTKHLTIRKK